MLVVLAVFGLAVLWTFMGDGDQTADYKYGQLIQDAREGRIESISDEGLRLVATMSNGEEKTAILPSELSNPIDDLGCAAGGDPGAFNCANLGATEESAAGGILTLLITALLPVLLIGGFIFFMMRQAQGTNNQALSLIHI